MFDQRAEFGKGTPLWLSNLDVAETREQALKCLRRN